MHTKPSTQIRISGCFALLAVPVMLFTAAFSVVAGVALALKVV